MSNVSSFRHIFFRALAIIPTVFGALTLMFVIVRLLPSDPVSMVIDPAYRTPEVVAAVTKAMGLDRPLYEQFVIYFLNIFKGDLGFAWFTGRPVIDELSYRFPATLELLIYSLSLSIIIAIPLGVIGGWKRGKKIDGLISVFTLGGIVMPPFWWALILIFLFYYLVPIFPAPMGRLSDGVSITRITGVNTLDSLLTGNLVAFVDSLSHLVLPVIALTFVQLAILTKIQRAEIAEALESDYIKTARAKGMKESTVIFKHALRNSLIPTVTAIGLRFGEMIGGSVLIESVFNWPGMGKFAVDSIQHLDYAALQGTVVFTVLVFALTNLFIDIIYSLIDPRIGRR